MAEEPFRLFPFTNWSLVLNTSLNTVHKYSRVGNEDVVSGSSHNASSNLSPTSAFGEDSEMGTCNDWQDAQHMLFQLANLCAAVSLLTPGNFQHHLLFLRCLLIIAYLLFILWAGLFVCMMDVLVWNCVFFFVDSAHVISLIYNNIPSGYNPSLNELFTKRLKPLKVCRRDFADFCNLGNVVLLRKGGHYSVENHTPCGDKVSILLRGRLKVTHEGVFLHSIEPNEFVDSPEFDSLSLHAADSSEKFQVTITASEDSVIISWLYPTLRAYFASNSFLWAVFTNIIGKDISDKLYRIQELLLKNAENTQTAFMTRNSSMVNVRRCLHPTDGQRSDFTTEVPVRINLEPSQPTGSAVCSRNQVISEAVATLAFQVGMARHSACILLPPYTECPLHYHHFQHESKSSLSSFSTS